MKNQDLRSRENIASRSKNQANQEKMIENPSKSVLRIESAPTTSKTTKRKREKNKDKLALVMVSDTTIKENVASKRRKKGKEIVETTQKKQNSSSYGIRLRTTPYPLFTALTSMSTAQLNCITEMGFGGLIGMKMDSIPSNLGMHVAKVFDPQTMTLNSFSGPIPINEQTVKDMIGAPMGHISYDTCESEDFGASLKKEWQKQFNYQSIRPNDVSKQIMMSNVADPNFKMNFIVLFCNTMGECKYNGVCDLDVLNRVTPETRFQDINWCEYIVNRLRYCKNKWTGEDEKVFFCGPLATLVLVYVDSLKWQIPPVVRQRPAIKGWSFNMLKLRMESEINERGSLGLVETAEPYLPIEENIDDQPLASPSNIEGYLNEFDETYNKLIALRNAFKSSIERASNKFPGVALIDEWRKKEEQMFAKSPEDVEKLVVEDSYGSPEKNQASAVDIDATSCMEGGELQINDQTPIINEDAAVEAAVQAVVTPFMESDAVLGNDETPTQFFQHENVLEECDELVRMYKKKSKGGDDTKAPKAQKETEGEKKSKDDEPKEQVHKSDTMEKCNDEGPSFSIGMTQELADENETNVSRAHVEKEKQIVEPSTEVPSKREKRVALSLCSPYIDRKVVIHETITDDEKLVLKWITAKKGNREEGIYRSKEGKMGLRMQFETMLNDTHVHFNIIDIWSCILNNEEELRSMSSPYRLFCTTSTMTEDMIPPNMRKERMFEIFSSKLVESMKNRAEMLSLKTVDMIFFPIKQQNHFYLIVFNLKTPSLVILDNKLSRMVIEDLYGDLPRMLQMALVNYMKSVKHPRLNSISKLKPQRYNLKWKTADPNKNSGIFLMRHMETFKGETVSKYVCGILKEIEPQEAQLNKLRKKYLAKILLGNHNRWNMKVIRQATEFGKANGK